MKNFSFKLAVNLSIRKILRAKKPVNFFDKPANVGRNSAQGSSHAHSYSQAKRVDATIIPK